MSDSQIAEHVGVDHKTVLRYREELESSREIPKIETRTATRNGKEYEIDTTNIGRQNPEALKEKMVNPRLQDDD